MSTSGRIFPARLLQPAVACPRCQAAVYGWTNTVYDDGDNPGVGGMRGACGELPEHLLRATIVYTLYPCYCKVDQYWVSAFVEEMGRREKGKPARAVEGRWQTGRQARLSEIEAQLGVLYSKRDAAVVAGMATKRAGIERDICLLVTELQRITPGAGDRLPPIAVGREVAQWAIQRRLTLPRGSDGAAVAAEASRAQLIVDPQRLRTLLDAEPELEHHTAYQRTRLAELMYAEIQDFVASGAPVSQLTLKTVARLIPDAARFLLASEAAGPVLDATPDELFVDQETTVPRRRLDRFDRRPRTSPLDGPAA